MDWAGRVALAEPQDCCPRRREARKASEAGQDWAEAGADSAGPEDQRSGAADPEGQAELGADGSRKAEYLAEVVVAAGEDEAEAADAWGGRR
jgi:hypothetical protein